MANDERQKHYQHYYFSVNAECLKTRLKFHFLLFAIRTRL